MNFSPLILNKKIRGLISHFICFNSVSFQKVLEAALNIVTLQKDGDI